ncbi:hypothetical protein EIP86_005000 [Pleurotus ostreatoroseus]|nr:hypothetical protein EIP86_005000 [Pleurotus ostreatoroseus]
MLSGLIRTAHDDQTPVPTFFTMMTPALSLWLLLSSIFWSGAQAYIPASGSDVPLVFNNVTEASDLKLQWYAGKFDVNVSYVLVGANSNGVNKGVLVHFSEDDLTNDPNDNSEHIRIYSRHGEI